MFGVISVVALLLLLSAEMAKADYRNAEWAERPSPNAWSARGNGQRYLAVSPNEDVNGKIRVVADAGVVGRITEVHAWVELVGPSGSPNLSGRPWGYRKIYPFGDRKRNIDSTVDVQIPKAALRQWLVDRCHAQIIRLRDEGLSDDQIWSEDRPIGLNVRLRFEVGFSGPGSPNPLEVSPGSADMPQHNSELVCLKKTPSETPQVGGVQTPQCDERVLASELIANGVTSVGGTCKLVLKYVLRTSCPNMQVRFRLHEQRRDVWSNVISARSSNVRLAGGTLEYDLANEVGAEIGEVRMHGVSPTFISNVADYRMVCQDQGPVGGFTSGVPQQTPGFGVRLGSD